MWAYNGIPVTGDYDLTVLVTEDFPKGGRHKLPRDVIEAQTRIRKVLARSVKLNPKATGQPDIDYVAKALLAGENESMNRPQEGEAIRGARKEVDNALELTGDLMFLNNYWQRNGDRKRSAKMKQLADQMARERTVGFNLRGEETRR